MAVAVQGLLEKHFKVAGDRYYITFTDVPAANWGMLSRCFIRSLVTTFFYFRLEWFNVRLSLFVCWVGHHGDVTNSAK